MEVAVALGCTQQNYEFYEAGRNIIGSDRLREFAAALRTDPHTLHDILYPVEPFAAELAETEGFRLPGWTERQVTISRTPAHRGNRSIGAPLVRR